MPPHRLITLKGFLSSLHEQHKRRRDRPFCFILGAGASSASGIDTGSEMAREWLEQLHEAEDFTGSKLEDWATAENLGIAGFDIHNLGRFYPQLYNRRFSDNPQAGYAFLEDKMQGKDPSYGYSVLAYLLAETPHKIVITTNFDNLVADALSIHSTTFPIVVGHDALADYAQVDLRRPLIAKVHGGLGFAPKSSPDDLQALSESWQQALKRIFERYTPIIIGYDGNDGCFMKPLEEMKEGEIDGLYWCFYCPHGDEVSQAAKVPERVRKLVENKRDRLVPIRGFDELMLLIKKRLGTSIQMPNLLEQMKDRARKREAAYDAQEQALTEKLGPIGLIVDKSATKDAKIAVPPSEVDKMLSQAVGELAKDRKEKPWWVWQKEASAAKSADEKEQIYRDALAVLPQSAELIGNYAIFLKNERRDLDQAEAFYKRAVEADPKNAVHLGNYASFLCDERKDLDQAETFYKRAVEADSKNAPHLGNYATFLRNERKDLDQAEAFYKRAVEADPNYANNLGNYANFLRNERRDLDQAEAFYKRAVEADPKNANNLGNYAQHCLIQGRFEEGLEWCERAEALAPIPPVVQVELCFYRLAHDPSGWPSKLGQMSQLLKTSARSIHWPLEKNISVAKKAGHPNTELLHAIASVISRDEPLSTLDVFEEWKHALELIP